MRDFPLRTRLFIVAVAVLGAVVLALCVFKTWQAHVSDTELNINAIITLSLLVLGAEAFSAALARSVATRENVDISVGMPIAMASVLLLGPWGAPIVGVMVALEPRPVPWFKRSFNGGMNVLASFGAGWVYAILHAQLSGQQLQTFPTTLSFSPVNVLIPMLAATLTFEFINGMLMVSVLSLAESVSPFRIWFGTMYESALPLFIYSIFGLLIAVVWSIVGPLAAILVLAPLMVARWVFTMFSAHQQAYEATIRSLIQAVETKDAYTRGHSERVSRASVLIGRRSGMREDRVSSLRYAGMLHDVGKLGVPTRVLQKAGKLSDSEFDAIKEHPARGHDIVKNLDFLGEAIAGIHYHHERMDGRGYPEGLTGDQIPEFARIIAVADAFDSMTTTRSYRGARSIDDAIGELRRCQGTQFDPVLVEALISALEADAWELADTGDQVQPHHSSPTYASDHDDPTVSRELGLGGPILVPDDVSELEGWMGEIYQRDVEGPV
ncbi:MAG: HD-GYP domain-containing protein [Actinomycetes bacterium]